MTFRFDKLTIKAQEAVAKAQSLAADRGHPEVDALHLLAALLSEKEGVVRPVLGKIGADTAQLASIVDAELNHLPKISGGAQPQPNQPLGQVLEKALAVAREMKDEFVS
ncbi:MAG: ATP-dependent chaperone ClpB, partial [Pirellulales bacterium]|nr:ATP-dependent chaperone ClpB [Pirellulales bacterium]